MSDGWADDRRVYVAGDLQAPADVPAVEAPDAADVVVAVGESALLDIARQGCSTPVLPIDAGTGVHSVPESKLDDALESVWREETTEIELPILGVDVDSEHRARALLDVMLVTEEAAHISEFDLSTPTDDIARFRADGFVVATPAGTAGYARRLDAPVFDPTVEAAAVVPVAPFATSLDSWVVPLSEDEPIVVGRVTREEAAVSLLADDRIVGTVPPNVPVEIGVTDTLTIHRVPESRSCFDTPDGSPRDGPE
ncbi:MAG: NAD(+)/NADH kinase [Halapricum sp.]